ncbi:MAG TPA: DNA polymerase IV [Phycisphaerales bacterium]|nr:DNA polymerase IV [Phycisphaerales bacterium]
MPAERSILHADMDAFFASVEQLDHPELRGRPVLVGGAGRRAVVAAASYEARAFGCCSAMPTAVARRLCPDAVVVKPRGERYREVSRAVFEIFESVTPIIEPLSIDEAFLDVTGSIRLLGEPIEIARSIKRRVREETGLCVSVGVAPNKFLAKLASDMDKPDGLTVIERSRVDEILGPMPVSAIFGVGESAQRRLQRLGVRTIAQLRAMPEAVLMNTFGSFGSKILMLSKGIDDRPVVRRQGAKSVGHEQTFEEDIEDRDALRAILLGQTERVAMRLRQKELEARTVTLKVRFGDFETITRSETLDQPTHATEAIWNAVLGLFNSWASHSFRPVRLIGISASQLASPGGAQPSLFQPEEERTERSLDLASDAITSAFGPGAIRRAASLDSRQNRPGP